ncbi:MAG: hypothetical protein [Bacteriophage sp.]|jgi:hypothetical protein|nr:MAG: hypothetical protein [Bacteriophage sp.]
MADDLMEMIRAAEASSGPDPEIAMDTEFQQQQYLIESALRALGEMQRPQPGNANTIFDEQFRTLIDLVPME